MFFNGRIYGADLEEGKEVMLAQVSFESAFGAIRLRAPDRVRQHRVHGGAWDDIMPDIERQGRTAVLLANIKITL